MSPMLSILIDLAAATLAGALIGWERSYFGRAAGLRTHTLLTLGAAAIMSITSWPAVMTQHFGLHTFQFDPARLVQGVMTGLGFLGAGVIVKEGVSLYGLTSAASIWVSAVIGMLFGLGYWQTAAGVTLASLAILLAFRGLELFAPRQVYALAVFTFDAARTPGQDAFTHWLAERGARLDHLSMSLDPDTNRRQFRGTVQVRREAAFRGLDDALVAYPGLVGFELARNNK